MEADLPLGAVARVVALGRVVRAPGGGPTGRERGPVGAGGVGGAREGWGPVVETVWDGPTGGRHELLCAWGGALEGW